MNPTARDPHQRKQDTLARLDQDVDLWVATADASTGTPYLVPLSFVWDGADLLISTPSSSPTSRNLQGTGKVRLGIGLTRDVVLIEGTVRAVRASELSTEIGDTFATKTGFDPRRLSGYLYFWIRPQLIQAWREADELTGRDLMHDGNWLISD